MLFKTLKISLIISLGLLVACGESDSPQEVTTAPVEEMAPAVVEETTEVVDEIVTEETDTETEVTESTSVVVQATEQMVNEVQETVSEEVADVEEQVESVANVSTGNKPYQVVDGAISANAVEGWKTYNGGGCGACHGKGGIGGVGPNLGQSVTTKLSKEQFVDIVTNGKPGTMMRAHNTNTRVMDNLDNLYAYLVARGDDVLGPGNLIKLPLGKE
jgi:mono/diheme cytochrome c family protein